MPLLWFYMVSVFFLIMEGSGQFTELHTECTREPMNWKGFASFFLRFNSIPLELKLRLFFYILIFWSTISDFPFYIPADSSSTRKIWRLWLPYYCNKNVKPQISGSICQIVAQFARQLVISCSLSHSPVLNHIHHPPALQFHSIHSTTVIPEAITEECFFPPFISLNNHF